MQTTGAFTVTAKTASGTGRRYPADRRRRAHVDVLRRHQHTEHWASARQVSRADQFARANRHANRADRIACHDQHDADCDDRIRAGSYYRRSRAVCAARIADVYGCPGRPDRRAWREYGAASHDGIRAGGRRCTPARALRKNRHLERRREFDHLCNAIPDRNRFRCCHADNQQRDVCNYFRQRQRVQHEHGRCRAVLLHCIWTLES